MDDQIEGAQPLVLDEAGARQDGWDDSVRGRIHWRTLFSQGLTPSAGLTCGLAELEPAIGSDCIGMRRRRSTMCSPAPAS